MWISVSGFVETQQKTLICQANILHRVVVVSIGRVVTIIQAGDELELDPTCKLYSDPTTPQASLRWIEVATNSI